MTDEGGKGREDNKVEWGYLTEVEDLKYSLVES